MSRKAFRSLTLVPVVALSMQLTACSDDASVADDSTTSTFTTTGGETETGTTTGAEGGSMDVTTNGDGDGDSDAEAEATGDGDGDGDATGDGDGDGDSSGDGDGDSSGDGDGDGDSCLVDDPCVNGTCNDAGGTITCTCAMGWGGDVCDGCDVGYHPVGAACVIDEDCTATDPCTANGTCNDSTGIIVCDCTMGYAGDTCDTCDTGYHDEGGTCVIDESCLITDPCQNGQCNDGGGIITCACDQGWTGDVCDTCAPGYHDESGACVLDTDCEINTCGGNGDCDDTSGVPTCTCFMGYAGTFCDSCDSGYHDEGGVCVIDETCGSAADTCVNGDCFIAGGVVNCDCDENWEGDDCDTCPSGRFDCNQDVSDGCEAFVACTCVPGATRDCYDGFPSDTEDVGECEGGTQTCNPDGHSWSGCAGQTIPTFEVCGNNMDDDCDGIEDESDDLDGDNYGVCEGDCCDSLGPDCGSPGLVNPGAFEVVGDGIDNDCNPGTSDVTPASCEVALGGTGGEQTQANAIRYLKAIELCNETTSNATGEDKTWGVITNNSGNFLRPRIREADGSTGANLEQMAVRPDFGTGAAMQTREGDWFSVLSTGLAAAEAHTNPSFVEWQAPAVPPLDDNTSGVYSDWSTAVGGTAPAAPSCNQNSDIDEVHNPVSLEFQVRAPTNANSFTVDMYLLSSEYPEWVCDAFNDFVVVLIDEPGGGAVNSVIANPTDENLAVFSNGSGDFPVGVNLAAAGLFTHCNEQVTRDCAIDFSGGSTENNPVTCTDGQIEGSGYESTEDSGYCADFFCNNFVTCYGANTPQNGRTGDVGGGTGWLRVTGNVEPGEIFRMRAAIWDSGDRFYDSTVMLDNWQWNADPATPGVTPA